MNSDETKALVAAIKTRFGGCFGCGVHNPIGLHLDGFVIEGSEVVCDWKPRPEYQSFPEVLHGGIVTAALDEVMAWTAMLLTHHAVVTGTMDLRFRRPAPTDARFTLRGRLDDHRGRRVMLAASMTDQDDIEVASATAMFLTTQSLGDVETEPQPSSQKPIAR